ncbi:MAG TPA: glycosyltransferase [Acidimicrobiales bacterium]
MSATLSIVIPAYNESERLEVGYQRLAPTLAQLGPSNVEVIVVDDGSSDDTLKRAHAIYGHLEHALFVQQPTNMGKGAAMRLGMALATGRHVVTLDADMAIDPRHLIEIDAALDSSALVPGSRAINGHIKYNKRFRTLAGGAFNRLVRHYTGTKLRDTQCGFKGYQLGPGRVLALLSMVDGFAFDVEVLYLATQLGLGVTPLHVSWKDVGGSSVHPGHDAWGMFRDIRSFKTTRYENPVVELALSVTPTEVDKYAREARTQGLVIARNDRDALLILGRNDALAGLGIATALKGTLRTAQLGELRGRRFEAV